MTHSEAIRYKPHPYVFIGVPKEDYLISVRDVFEKIFNHTGVTEQQIKDSTRVAHVRQARQMIAAYCVLELGMTMFITGKVINRDHTTVLHSRNLMIAEIARGTPVGLLYKQIFNL